VSKRALETRSDSSDSDIDNLRSKCHSRSSVKGEPQHVIRVPTKELAEFAVRAAFEQGCFNINVIVE
jgi:hypothetical protein